MPDVELMLLVIISKTEDLGKVNTYFKNVNFLLPEIDYQGKLDKNK